MNTGLQMSAGHVDFIAEPIHLLDHIYLMNRLAGVLGLPEVCQFLSKAPCCFYIPIHTVQETYLLIIFASVSSLTVFYDSHSIRCEKYFL